MLSQASAQFSQFRQLHQVTVDSRNPIAERGRE